MADCPAPASDRVSEQQGQKLLNAVSAGLNPCSTSFNDAYKDMLKTQQGNLTEQQGKPELAPEVEERLSKDGYNMQEIASDPESHQAATNQAATRAKDDIIQAEVESQ